MGYYTKYVIRATPELTDKMIESLISLTRYEFDSDGEEMWADIKWWDYDSEMRKFSLMFPDTVFTVQGQGEEQSDRWMEYWKKGKSQNAYLRIEYDEFDETKLIDGN